MTTLLAVAAYVALFMVCYVLLLTVPAWVGWLHRHATAGLWARRMRRLNRRMARL